MTSDKGKKAKGKTSNASGKSPKPKSGQYMVSSPSSKTRRDEFKFSANPMPLKRTAKTKTAEIRAESEAGDPSTWKRDLLDILDNNSAARKDLSEDEVILEDHHGKPVFVVLDYQHYAAIVAKLEDLLDAQSARDALEALRCGDEKTTPWETIKADLVTEGLIDG